ncbi:UDP-glucose 4-epimerase GalE [Idiomarina loihiensis]|uniref:UDP-glucose 4-epimerase n=1 Tax=Idiomarina loihiensis (strain ATCC BAA-735 / DSM 15497 / L2-TR) TaxID=283942 RepID=Q5QWU4_IDILO|nr:UDP-glucose 4-epimerase GalE [Idiomarina loihiensis]AAV81400.1 UDP-glucose 4-epimerase [Idiomarina loihiensis L2TR]AGM35427.1 UDP-glucose 4-epimerase [Idiomarina loihiensis GSL 199]
MILVTGGAGYIGTHCCVELIESGYDIVVLDNLKNSTLEGLRQVERIVNKRVRFVEGDVRDLGLLEKLFGEFKFNAVLHLAGLKSVNESLSHPVEYYENNVTGSLSLLKVMEKFGCKCIVFSSSATVYGHPECVPISENSTLSTINPYGSSKLMVENILRDLSSSTLGWSIGILRYFNPVGAHESGLIGELPLGVPNNLMPYIAQVALGKLEKLTVFGNDYNTKDGTGVRDYIHVVDLAKGHVEALRELFGKEDLFIANLGTGVGYSVLELIKNFEKISGRKVPYEVGNRRRGDVAACYADPSYAKSRFGWSAEFDIDRMCHDTWRWMVKSNKTSVD